MAEIGMCEPERKGSIRRAAHQGQWWGTKGSRLSGSPLHCKSRSQALRLTVQALWVLDLAQGLIGKKIAFFFFRMKT